jgi:uncharacterized protein YndB with AHSA1/START domain
MPAAAGDAPKTGLTIDREANTIRLVREFPAPPQIIFEAWTQPEQVSCWWDPAGERLSECTIDLRPGGSFRFVSPGHPEMPFAGVYREINPPHRLEFEAMAATGRVTIEASTGGARMTVEIECSSAEHLDQYLRMGVDKGTAQTLDNLVAYVKGRREAA